MEGGNLATNGRQVKSRRPMTETATRRHKTADARKIALALQQLFALRTPISGSGSGQSAAIGKGCTDKEASDDHERPARNLGRRERRRRIGTVRPHAWLVSVCHGFTIPVRGKENLRADPYPASAISVGLRPTTSPVIVSKTPSVIASEAWRSPDDGLPSGRLLRWRSQ